MKTNAPTPGEEIMLSHNGQSVGWRFMVPTDGMSESFCWVEQYTGHELVRVVSTAERTMASFPDGQSAWVYTQDHTRLQVRTAFPLLDADGKPFKSPEVYHDQRLALEKATAFLYGTLIKREFTYVNALAPAHFCLMLQEYPNPRDMSIYRGRQFYWRAIAEEGCDVCVLPPVINGTDTGWEVVSNRNGDYAMRVHAESGKLDMETAFNAASSKFADLVNTIAAFRRTPAYAANQ